MIKSREHAIQCLQEHAVKPSVQRIAVMEYLLTHQTHPTVDIIYNALIGKMPTLSRATVYNTLKLLTEKGAVRQLTINDQHTHYDGDTCRHAHFLCHQCGKVFDVPLHGAPVEESADIPEGFKVETSELYFRGICPACAHKKK